MSDGTPLRVALVTGDLDAVRAGYARRIDAPLVAALTAEGAEATIEVWSDAAVDWGAYDVVVVRTVWDYPGRRDAFLAWAAATAERTVVCNPVDVLRWNTHKSYLLELEERGAPVVSTAWLGAGDRVALDALLAARGWPRAVLKPAVGVGSYGVRRVTTDADEAVTGPASPANTAPTRAAFLGPAEAQRHLDALLADGDVLVQPYLDAVETDGELSVVVIDGEPSHAVRKTPSHGEFRVQSSHGGTYVEVLLDRETAALAKWMVQSTGVELAFARVDLLDDASGTPQLVELEATEPDLQLEVVPTAAPRVAHALLARARR